jgi:hypothetical protein
VTRVVLAVPCHRDEPGVSTTVRQLLDQSEGFAGRVLVCVNGSDPDDSPAARSLQSLREGEPRLEVLVLDRASKPAAWNRLRQEPADVTVFCDADVDLEPGSVQALVSTLTDMRVVLATARQEPSAVGGVAARVATVPFRLKWGGVAGTLYAARTAWLPEMPTEVLLDDAWLWAQASANGPGSVVRVDAALARFKPARTWGDLWRQRMRAEAGKRQLRDWGLELAPEPDGGRPGLATLKAYPATEWPAVAALATIKLAAGFWAARRPPTWGTAPSTKT